MDSKELKKKILEDKKQRVREIIYLVCGKEKLPAPKINFSGCPQETQDQLAHYHPEQNKICISVTQLYKLKSMTDVENTIYHELAHILVQSHGGEFTKTKNKFKIDTWRPPHGVIFISAEKQRHTEKAKIGPVETKVDKIRCNYHLCRKQRILSRCPYCKNYFCKEHIRPVVPAELTSEWSATDFGESDYHPCPEYVDFVKRQKEKEIEDYGKALDTLKYKNTSYTSDYAETGGEKPIKQERQVNKKEREDGEAAMVQPHTDINDKSHIQIEHKTEKAFKPWFPSVSSEGLKKWFSEAYHAKYTKGYTSSSHTYTSSSGSNHIRLELPIKALLIAIAVTVLTLPPLNLITYGNVSFALGIFASLLLFTDFLIVVVLVLIYDKLVAKHYLTYQALIGGFLLAVLISTGIIQSLTNSPIVNFVAVFLTLLIGFAVGGVLYDKANYGDHLNILNGGTVFLILIWLVYLFANINATGGGSSLSTLLSNFITNLESSAGSGSNTQSPPPAQEVLNVCLTEVNSALQIAEAKLPSGTSVNIVNTTTFYYGAGTKMTINNINTWITIWNSGYSFGSGESCFSYYPTLFTCGDLNTLSTELNNTKNLSYGSIVGAGVAIKFQFSPEAQSNGFTEVAPVLCDPSGIMTSSNSYLRNKNSYN